MIVASLNTEDYNNIKNAVKPILNEVVIQTLRGVPAGEESRFGIGKPSDREAQVHGPMRRVFSGRAYQFGRYVDMFKETTRGVNRSQGDHLPLTTGGNRGWVAGVKPSGRSRILH